MWFFTDSIPWKTTIIWGFFSKHRRFANLSFAVKSWKMWYLVTLTSTHRSDPMKKLVARVEFFSWVVATSKRYSVEEVNCCRTKLQIIAVSWIDHVCGSGCFWMSLGYFVVWKNSLQNANDCPPSPLKWQVDVKVLCTLQSKAELKSV